MSAIPIGTRVRVAGKPTKVTLASPDGIIVEDLDEADYCVVRLDRFATYDAGNGNFTALREIAVMYDNLTVIDGDIP